MSTSMGVTQDPVEEAIDGNPTKSKARGWRKGRIVETRRMVEEPTASLEEGSQATVENLVETTAATASEAAIDETPNVATDTEVISEAVESPSAVFEDLSVTVASPAGPTPEESDHEPSDVVEGSEHTDEASVLAGDLEWRRRSFLPKRRRSNVELADEAETEPSISAEVAAPGDSSPEPLDVRELPEADGSGSYWDISTRIVPKVGQFSEDDDPPAGQRDTYWRKSRRRY